MVVLWIVCVLLVLPALLLFVIYLTRPHLLILPYSWMVGLWVKNPPFVDRQKYSPESLLLESNWKKVQDELVEILKIDKAIPKFHEVDAIQRFISAKDEIAWRTFGLMAFGEWIESNCARAPYTTSLLKRIPGVSLAMFSILDPGKRIPPHFGFNKMVYRYHLGLIVPTEGDCWIRVGPEVYRWKEGEGVMFDDTYNHEVLNDSSQRRAVLFLDISRERDFPRWLLALNRRMYRLLSESKKVKDGLKRAEVPIDAKAES